MQIRIVKNAAINNDNNKKLLNSLIDTYKNIIDEEVLKYKSIQK